MTRLTRFIRDWLRERQAWREFAALPAGHPDKYIAAIRLVHGDKAADAVAAARKLGGTP